MLCYCCHKRSRPPAIAAALKVDPAASTAKDYIYSRGDGHPHSLQSNGKITATGRATATEKSIAATITNDNGQGHGHGNGRHRDKNKQGAPASSSRVGYAAGGVLIGGEGGLARVGRAGGGCRTA